jgi:hypothetical protein
MGMRKQCNENHFHTSVLHTIVVAEHIKDLGKLSSFNLKSHGMMNT